jgi:hypothetical protein
VPVSVSNGVFATLATRGLTARVGCALWRSEGTGWDQCLTHLVHPHIIELRGTDAVADDSAGCVEASRADDRTLAPRFDGRVAPGDLSRRTRRCGGIQRPGRPDWGECVCHKQSDGANSVPALG